MKHLRLFLPIIGTVCFLLGIGFVVSASDITEIFLANPHLAPEGSVYVKSGTCFTCHAAQPDDKNNPLRSLTINDHVTEPSVVHLDIAVPEETRDVEVWAESRPYTLEDVSLSAMPQFRQRYVIYTEDGTAIIPEHWDIGKPKWIDEATDSDESTSVCTSCHTLNLDSAVFTFNEVDVTCVACHDPVRTHNEAAFLMSIHRLKARFTHASS